jgi:hypothetical protein
MPTAGSKPRSPRPTGCNDALGRRRDLAACPRPDVENGPDPRGTHDRRVVDRARLRRGERRVQGLDPVSPGGERRGGLFDGRAPGLRRGHRAPPASRFSTSGERKHPPRAPGSSPKSWHRSAERRVSRASTGGSSKAGGARISRASSRASRPSEATWRAHEETVAVLSSSGSVSWQRRTPRNDGSLRWRRFIYESKTSASWISTPATGRSGRGRFRTRTGRLSPGEFRTCCSSRPRRTRSASSRRPRGRRTGRSPTPSKRRWRTDRG